MPLKSTINGQIKNGSVGIASAPVIFYNKNNEPVLMVTSSADGSFTIPWFNLSEMLYASAKSGSIWADTKLQDTTTSYIIDFDCSGGNTTAVEHSFTFIH